MATRPGLLPARLKKVYGSMPPLDKMYIYNVQFLCLMRSYERSYEYYAQARLYRFTHLHYFGRFRAPPSYTYMTQLLNKYTRSKASIE